MQNKTCDEIKGKRENVECGVHGSCWCKLQDNLPISPTVLFIFAFQKHL